jgi:molybdate transport system ATP-binding protein
VSGLTANVAARRGAFTLAVDLHAPSARTLAVLGRNGAGKSTLLDVLVGRLRPERGEVRIGDRVLSDAAERIHVPPERRRVGLLSQAPSLFPHLSAQENVAFAPRAAGASRIGAREEAVRLLDAVGLRGLEDRRPARLSGGQQQRVALARALAARPDVLLLDEPFSALDVSTAADMRMLTAETLERTGTTAVVVTHDVVDALSLGHSCVVLDAGRVVDGGDLAGVLGMPRSPFVAALAGMNLLAGEAAGDGVVHTDDGLVLRGHEIGVLRPGHRSFAAFPPAAVRLGSPHAAEPAGSAVGSTAGSAAAPALAAVVEGWELGTAGIRVRFRDGLLADVPPAEFASLRLRRGDRVHLVVPPEAVSVYAAGEPVSGADEASATVHDVGRGRLR